MVYQTQHAWRNGCASMLNPNKTCLSCPWADWDDQPLTVSISQIHLDIDSYTVAAPQQAGNWLHTHEYFIHHAGCEYLHTRVIRFAHNIKEKTTWRLWVLIDLSCNLNVRYALRLSIMTRPGWSLPSGRLQMLLPPTLGQSVVDCFKKINSTQKRLGQVLLQCSFD